MILFETAFAVALLTAPASDPASPGQLSHLAPSRQSLLTLAVEWEILDPREVHLYLAGVEQFEGDIGSLRRRLADLEGCPPLADHLRFPDQKSASELLEFNREFRKVVLQRQEAEPALWWEYQQVIDEIDCVYQTWDLLRDAGGDCYHVTCRRRDLKSLRERLGNEAYYRGEMPPHVPLWRFVRVD